jgi:DNA-nicking Smr family endonuclease
MKPPRGLSAEEAALWARVAASVAPMFGKEIPSVKEGAAEQRLAEKDGPETEPAKPAAARPRRRPSGPPPPTERENHSGAGPGLDSHWERRLRAGSLAPDFTLDLHEHSLDAAYHRLLGGLDIARETGARVVLVIAGRERHAPAADRSGQRGAIRAKLLDWLAASRHAGAIAAIRKAHRRHGGDGALYVILKKPR